jgi:hypothetical protein
VRTRLSKIASDHFPLLAELRFVDGVSARRAAGRVTAGLEDLR